MFSHCFICTTSQCTAKLKVSLLEQYNFLPVYLYELSTKKNSKIGKFNI